MQRGEKSIHLKHTVPLKNFILTWVSVILKHKAYQPNVIYCVVSVILSKNISQKLWDITYFFQKCKHRREEINVYSPVELHHL